ncbi:MAG TPA: magnesium transporter [Candidatus Macondimonas sp.]|nr:magnesium transporter [Candidatus Macondimonas sp.]
MAGRRRRPASTSHSDTAAHYMVGGVPRARPEQTAGEVVDALRGRSYDCVALLCVLDPEDRLLGVVPIAALLTAARDQPVGEALIADCPRVHPDEDQERVATLALHHDLAAVPVIDHGERLLGMVPTDALLRILRHEHVEDIHRLAGISRETQQARQALQAAPLRRVRHRLPWLLVGLAGSMVATFIMTRFEQTLAANMAISFFVPGLVYLADAIGTQSEAVAVRGLSLSHAGLARLVGGELRTGLLIGLIMGVITFPCVWLAFGDPSLALAVAVALFAAGGMATTVGLLLPWLLQRLGTDPAYGSGPLATVIQDVLSLLIYFAVASMLVA